MKSAIRGHQSAIRGHQSAIRGHQSSIRGNDAQLLLGECAVAQAAGERLRGRATAALVDGAHLDARSVAQFRKEVGA